MAASPAATGSTTPTADPVTIASRLANPSVELKVKESLASDIRDRVDALKDAELTEFVTPILPVVIDALQTGTPAFKKDDPEYSLRHTLLGFLQRVPLNETVRNVYPRLVGLLLHIVAVDNEENGVLAINHLTACIRTFKGINEEHVAPFFVFYKQFHQNMVSFLTEHLGSPAEELPSDGSLLPASRSCKVLQELPIVAVVSVQTFKHTVVPMLADVVPHMAEFLNYQPKIQGEDILTLKARGESWTDISRKLTNLPLFYDLLSCQSKNMSYFSYFIRTAPDPNNLRNILPTLLIRHFKLIPPEAVGTRRDTLVALRNITSTDLKKLFVSSVDELTNEHVLLGDGVSSVENLKAVAFSAVADLIHNIRQELSMPQLTRIGDVYSRKLHDLTMQAGMHILSAKMVASVCDTLVQKNNPVDREVTAVLCRLFESCVSKMKSIHIIYQAVQARLLAMESSSKFADMYVTEKWKPVGSYHTMLEAPEDTVKEIRPLYRTVLHAMKSLSAGLHRSEGQGLTGQLLGSFFTAVIQNLALLDGRDPREEKEHLDNIGSILSEMHPYVFQEVWRDHMDFFYKQTLQRPNIMQICNPLLAHESTSATLTSTILKYLMEKLELLGELSDADAAVTIRLFKTTFTAVGIFPERNEPILSPHLSKLIMESFAFAARATEPAHYFHLLRQLFRAIGGGGGRFELLYKEVLPLLPEMLECLNRHLLAAPEGKKELLVELCLTVPLRLTHLLPYLSYLMRPLVYALQGTPELVTQGLRTLELCIDNLTSDFLDPTMAPVLREMMDALHKLLKPLPASHQHAHVAIRILGKLGGRNRKLLDEHPSLEYEEWSQAITLSVSFGGTLRTLDLAPLARLAARNLKHSEASRQLHIFEFVKRAIELSISSHQAGQSESVVADLLTSLFNALHIEQFQAETTALVKKLLEYVIRIESENISSLKSSFAAKPAVSAFSRLYLDAASLGLALTDSAESLRSIAINVHIIKTVMHGTKENLPAAALVRRTLLQYIAARYSSLCFESSWPMKNAGYRGIVIITDFIGDADIRERDVELIRALFYVLKDMSNDLPKNSDDIFDALYTLFRSASKPNGQSASQQETGEQSSRIPFYIPILTHELQNAHPAVRAATQKCMTILSQACGKTPYEMLHPVRERLLNPIYQKPLRALPISTQIGNVEAVSYTLSLEPPLPEANDEFLRMLHEALALALADDQALIGRNTQRQIIMSVIKLRVSCIRLLTASLPLTDFFSRQHETRQKVTGVYFKSLYSVHPEVKEVAHEGLRVVLSHQSRLPKDLLQTGLRPILMNLADPKRLSVSGLDGLARLLELLTSYFKVEIGTKLLDHFKVIAEPQMLRESASRPVSDNEDLSKLVGLVNVFHLLPSSANMFLADLVNVVVQTESCMECSAPSIFTEPLAKYLNRYPSEAVNFFLSNLHSFGHVRTLRTVLASHEAPFLLDQLASRTSQMLQICMQAEDKNLLVSGLTICVDLSKLSKGWVQEQQQIFDPLLDLWNSEIGRVQSYEGLTPGLDSTRCLSLTVDLFSAVLKEMPRLDILFDVVKIYTCETLIDLFGLTSFLHEHIVAGSTLILRASILNRFLTWISDSAVAWNHKTLFTRMVLTPMLRYFFEEGGEPLHLLDSAVLNQFQSRIWRPLAVSSNFASAGDAFMLEVLNLTTIVIRFCHTSMSDTRKHIIKIAWSYITSDEVLLKLTAYAMAAQFFEAFDSPEKFLMRAWTGLLQPPTQEGRLILRSGLDVLANALPKRISAKTNQFPDWAMFLKRRILEEHHGSIPALLNMYQLIIRNEELFYPYRSLYVSHMATHLMKLGFQSSTTDSKTVTLELVELILCWDRRTQDRIDSMNEVVRTRSSRLRVDESQFEQEHNWTTPLPCRENIVSYLVRVLVHPPNTEMPFRTLIAPRATTLLRSVLSTDGWQDVSVKLNFFVRTLEQEVTEQTLFIFTSTARVLSVVADGKPDSWFVANGEILPKLLKKGMSCEEAAIHESLYPVLHRILQLYPLPKDDEESAGPVAELHAFIHSTISERLRNLSSVRGSLLMLKSIVQTSPERMESFGPGLMKLLNKLTKEHLLQLGPSSTSHDGLLKMLTTTLDVCFMATAHLGEQRRVFMTTLTSLVEKSGAETLCRFLLDQTRSWVFENKDIHPTMREKANLLNRMVTFERFGDVLLMRYLELIYEIYTDPSFRRSELTSRLENAFMMGCYNADGPLRDRFIDLMDAATPRSVANRLIYITTANWEQLSPRHWIGIALDLLLSAVTMGSPESQDMLLAIRRMVHLDAKAAHQVWISAFSGAWSSLSRKEQMDVAQYLIVFLTRDYHLHQADLRPNIVQTVLAGIHSCLPPVNLSAHMIKYLARNYGAWHVCLEILQDSFEHLQDDEDGRDTTHEALAEVYADLLEEDYFYGLWRRRALHKETNSAMSLEQSGMWADAQLMYETAQGLSRGGSVPFVEGEQCLWEDHWILSAQKLQQWDILTEFAKSEGNHDLALECIWRTQDWSAERISVEEHLNAVNDVPTPRRRVFEAFIALLKNPQTAEKSAEFSKLLDEAMQLSLRKWISLPEATSKAHVPLLQLFQQFVELQESVPIFNSLASTTAGNLDKKSADLKLILQAWRERLPNLADDIDTWSDLVAWRRNVFSAINKAYMPLIGVGASGGAPNNSANTAGYRGYHETAWIINRFAHIARKHHLLDVCTSQLNKIYNLPNIEISEAFLKLREQARCHFQRPEEIPTGLDVINNTNLMYFSNSQKAEFYTLKGMFFSKLNRNEEANNAFNQAVQIDMSMPKAWAEWGRWSDKMFKEHPSEVNYAAEAVTNYMQAAGLYKNAKSRSMLHRVLWLLSLDDTSHTISKQFDMYKGEHPFWYWLTSVPHLISSLLHREAKQARYILLNLAKNYPQALFFQLRTSREEAAALKKHMQAMANAAGGQVPGGDVSRKEGPTQDNSPQATRPTVEHIDEVISMLKTAFPLLVLTLENLVEQLSSRFRASPEEDVFRFFNILLGEALVQLNQRSVMPNDDGAIPAHVMNNASRFIASLPQQSELRREFEERALKPGHTLHKYVIVLRDLRDEYESWLDNRVKVVSLDSLSHYLVEFQHLKLDEIDVPGQYLEHKESTANFVRISRFGSKVEICRGHLTVYRRFTVHGTDGTQHTFALQQPAGRHGRREERLMQLYREFNSVLCRKKNARQRNLHFHLPAIVPFSFQVRIVKNDRTYATMQDMYDRFCAEKRMRREDPMIRLAEKWREVVDHGVQINKGELGTLRIEFWNEIRAKFVPADIISKYMRASQSSPSDLWRMRKQFTLQIASASFLTYTMSLSSRYPSRFSISRSTGLIYVSESLPAFSMSQPGFMSSESVPFRLTPNMQHFISAQGIEGVLTPGIAAIARSLTDPEFDLEQSLSLFSRDELLVWFQVNRKSLPSDLRVHVNSHAESVVKKAETLASKPDLTANRPLGNVYQSLIAVVSSAMNPVLLARMPEPNASWF